MQLKQKKGNTLLEFALIATVFFVLMFGIIEYGIMFYDIAVITNASNQGARYGIVMRTPNYATSAAVVTYTQTYLTSYLFTNATNTTPTVTATPSVTPPISGTFLTVTVSYSYTYFILSSLLGFNKTITLTSTTVMPYE